jgi:hypothetical protein
VLGWTVRQNGFRMGPAAENPEKAKISRYLAVA